MFKKYLAILAVILTLPATAMAGQMGGLASAMGGQLLTTTVYVGLIDRPMNQGGVDDDFKSNTLTVRATYGFSDKLDIYATVGKANIDGLAGVDDSLETLLGGGVKFLLFEGVNNTRVTINADGRFMEVSNAEYREFSAAVIISKKNGNLTPYGGLKLSDVEIELVGTNWEEEKNTGFFAGVDYFVNPNVYFVGEIHVFAENTLYAGVGYNF